MALLLCLLITLCLSPLCSLSRERELYYVECISVIARRLSFQRPGVLVQEVAEVSLSSLQTKTL